MRISESELLNFIADRLVLKYGESPNTDYILNLRAIAKESEKRSKRNVTKKKG